MVDSAARDLGYRGVIESYNPAALSGDVFPQCGESGYIAFKNTNLLLRSGFRPKIGGPVHSLPALLEAPKKLI